MEIGERVIAPEMWGDEAVTISSINKNFIGVKMVGFEEKGDVRIGEHYLKRNHDEPDMKMSDSLPSRESQDAFLNGIANATNMIDQEMAKRAGFEGGVIFFSPDMEMVEWLKDYSGDRMLIDVGSGSGHLLNLLKNRGKRYMMGIEPTFDFDAYLGRMTMRSSTDLMHILPKPVEECAGMLKNWVKTKKACLLFSQDLVIVILLRKELTYYPRGPRLFI